MELDQTKIPTKLLAKVITEEELEDLQSAVECQDLDLAEKSGLLLYCKGKLHTVIRDFNSKYELIDLDYLSEDFDLYI